MADTKKQARVEFRKRIEQNGGFIHHDDMRGCWYSQRDGVPECRGWAGGDKRCDCGNHRVYLELRQDSDGKWYARAEVG